MIKQRILQLIEHKGVVKEKFFEIIGMTSANFRGSAQKRPINSNAIENIFSQFPDVNLKWLITGNGPMLQENAPPIINDQDYMKLKEEIIELQREVIRLQKENAELKINKSSEHPAVRSVAGKLEKK